MELSNAKVLVTGGSSGIGKATARKLVRAGGEVVIAARDMERLQEAADETGAIPIRCDVGVEREVIDLVEQTIDILGGYNVLINNAGYGVFSKLVHLPTQDFTDQLRINTIGAMMVARESAKYFIRKSYGNIINVSSTAGRKGFDGGTAYAASKFALSGMTECWRTELRSHNIRVMQINPSEVQTEFYKNADMGSRPYNKTKLVAGDVAKTICDMLTLADRGFIPEVSVWATNPR